MAARSFLRRSAAWAALVVLACAAGVRGQDAAQRAVTGAALRGIAGQFGIGARNATARDSASPRDRAAITRQVYDQLLLQDRRARLVLERARRELDGGNTAAGLELVQHLLDRPDDAFVWLEDESRLSSLRKEVDRLIGGRGRDVLDTYERLHGPEAERLLLEAKRTGEPDRFREVVRRFFHTKAGFEATDWLAVRWLDHGQPTSAARAWSRLLDEPSHRGRITRDVIAKAALAWHLAGESEKARETFDALRTAELRVAGWSVSAEGWLAGLPAAAGSELEPRSDWRLYLGTPSRVRPVQATTPYPQPVWTASFFDGESSGLLSLLEQWEGQQTANLRPTAIATHPLVVGGVVVARDWAGIAAFELATGRPAWSYRGAGSLVEASKRRSIFDSAYQRRATGVAPSGQPELNLKHALAENSIQGTLAADGERVYAVELAELRWPRAAGRLPNPMADDRRRSANRLIALALRPDGSQADSGVEPLWSVGGPAAAAAAPAPAGNPPGVRRVPRPEADDAAVPAPAEPPREPGSLTGYFFLGPPLPLDGRLYAIAEHDREIRLVVLEPETGRLLRVQGLGGVELPIEEDQSRYFRACTPAFARGVLVCPTGSGLLIGLDPLDGTLLWSQFCGNASLAGQPMDRRGAMVMRMEHGHGGFNAAPQIHGSRVLYLPPESETAYCLDLTTGEIQWTLSRADGEYIGAITDELVLVVGQQFCRGVALDTGEVTWQVRHGMPAGRGLHVGGRYLLPLDDGRVATIDLASGREIGNSHVASARRVQAVLGSASAAGAAAAGEDAGAGSPEAIGRPGNLVAASGMIVSVSRRGLAAFRETGVLREELQERLREQPPAPRDQLLAAELELMQGSLDEAETLLGTVLSTAADGERQRAEALLRELLYLRLDAGGDAATILARLEPLSSSRGDRARFLLRKAEFALAGRELETALETIQELAALDSEDLLPDHDNPHHQLSAAAWARHLLGRMAASAGEDRRPVFEARLAADRDAALDSDGVETLQRFLAVWSGWPGVALARTELAERLIDRGRLHEAELLLLENRFAADPEVAAEATRRLAVLWDGNRHAHDAGELLHELATRFGDVRLSDGRTGRELVRRSRLPGGTGGSADDVHEADPARQAGPAFRDATRTAYLRHSQPLPEVSRVRVTEQLWLHNDPRLATLHRANTPAHATPVGSPLHVLLDRGDGVTASRLTIFSHETGGVVGHVKLPMETAYPAFSRSAYVGHFLPMGDQGAVSGVSLLERWREEPLWKVAPRELAGRNDVVRVGPAGPTFCAIQARRYLAVIDPADGRLLWQRTDLAGEAVFDTSESLVGDEHVLVVFSPDRQQYVVYETSSGRELRRGSLDRDPRQMPRVFGRRLVYVSSQPGARRLKIWDPLTDRVEYESDAGELLISTPIDDRELAFVLPAKGARAGGLRPFSRLVIVDVPAAEVRVDVDLGSERLMHLNHLRAFRDAERYYINFQRTIANRGAQHYSYFATDTYLPAEHMQGDLYAIDARSGQVLWNRLIPQRSILRLPGVRLPFLVSLARTRDRWNGSQQSLLLEAFDVRTGETLAWKENIFPDRIGQFAWRPEQQRLDLSGWHTTISLEFGPGVIGFSPGVIGAREGDAPLQRGLGDGFLSSSQRDSRE